MPKNYADIYASPNDSVSLAQGFYLKVESVRGTFAAPTTTDFFYTLPGSSISFSQPFESSMVRSGRHNTNIIKKKKESSFSLKTYFNIDLSLGAADVAEVDLPTRVLFQSLLGNEDVVSGYCKYNTKRDPQITFTLFEIGDRWCRQSRGGFIQDASLNFPGDGEATIDWSGVSKDALMAGIAKSTSTVAGGNIFHGQTGEGDQFQVGALVMVVKADGSTRSTDTSTPRTVTAILGDDITVSGAALTMDSDGSSGTPSYLVYWEPATHSGINQPVTGLIGSALITGLPSAIGMRQVTLKISNNHEVVNYIYGTDSLSAPYFVPAARLNVSVSVETNLNKAIVAFFNRVQSFQAQEFTFTLGDAAGRHFRAYLPKILFPVPAFSDPESGSIPITFEGTAYQTVDGAADEIELAFL